ncbi:hypothetical protein F4818DRAFT_437310 [Hypoxylon cercidicola]|nr:hypothetical protein F4818DRAFT_437310 [Hypoxylon cercidicola]
MSDSLVEQMKIQESNPCHNLNVVTDNSWTNDVFSALGKLNLNGRTIKNILLTAVAYANADNSALGFRHVLAIAKTELKSDEDLDKEVLRKRELEKKKQTEDSLQHMEDLAGTSRKD